MGLRRQMHKNAKSLATSVRDHECRINARMHELSFDACVRSLARHIFLVLQLRRIFRSSANELLWVLFCCSLTGTTLLWIWRRRTDFFGCCHSTPFWIGACVFSGSENSHERQMKKKKKKKRRKIIALELNANYEYFVQFQLKCAILRTRAKYVEMKWKVMLRNAHKSSQTKHNGCHWPKKSYLFIRSVWLWCVCLFVCSNHTCNLVVKFSIFSLIS